MSTFTDAMHAFVEASGRYTDAVEAGALEEDEDTRAEVLAQAGDVLESELRRMMREERGTVAWTGSVPNFPE